MFARLVIAMCSRKNVILRRAVVMQCVILILQMQLELACNMVKKKKRYENKEETIGFPLYLLQ